MLVALMVSATAEPVPTTTPLAPSSPPVGAETQVVDGTPTLLGFPARDEISPSTLILPEKLERQKHVHARTEDGQRVGSLNDTMVDYAMCAGDTIAATMYIASGGMQIAAAVKDCRLEHDAQRCSRDIFAVVRDFSQAAQHLTEALEVCGDIRDDCADAITTLIGVATTVGESASQMADVCGPTAEDLNLCARSLERLAWSLDPLGTLSARSLGSCSKDHAGKPYLDYGACVGEALGSAAYIAAAGMEIAYAVSACSSLPQTGHTAFGVFRGNGFATDFSGHAGRRRSNAARCVTAVSFVVRCFSLAASRANQAAMHCGGSKSTCGSDISLMSAAIFGVSEQASEMAQTCPPADVGFDWRLCGIFSSSMVKELAVVAAKAADSANSCRNIDRANSACASDISKTVAGVAFMAEEIVASTEACNKMFLQGTSLYVCSRRMERLGGQGANVVARGIGAAVLDCGLGSKPRLSLPLNLPEPFYT